MTTDDAQAPLYRPAAGVSWVVQDEGVRLIDELSRQVETLAHPAAAAWELLARGHDAARAAEMFGWIAGLPAGQAAAEVRRYIRQWTDAGWLEPGGNAGRDGATGAAGPERPEG